MEHSPMGSDTSSSSSSNSTPPVMDESQYSSQYLPLDFTLKDDDEAENGNERSDGNDGDGYNSTAESLSSLKPLRSELESSISDIVCRQNDYAPASSRGINNAMQPGPPSIPDVYPSSASLPLTVSHRGSLRRILSPSSFHASQNSNPMQSHGVSKQSQSTSSSWPMYIINVAAEGPQSPFPHSNTGLAFESNHEHLPPCYQIIFDRHQYEFCTRLFALLDTESQSFIGPDCIREFVSLHCPVVRRRDDAIFALRCSEEVEEENTGRERGHTVQQSQDFKFSSAAAGFSSPTFDEIWERTIHSDPRHNSADVSTPTIHRIGIEGWMVFCRLLALAHHQESQRRFASRHLQQMMRHKHGGGSTRDVGVVVVVENPPPGPPSVISISGLVKVEQERMMSHSDERILGWPFCPLPLLELDLDHSSVPTFDNGRSLSGMQRPPRGLVSIEPFSSSEAGDFILRFRNNGSRVVVRRSYSDFEWLNAILKLHKRPGQGHLCGRILPPFPTKRGGFRQQRSMLSKETLRTSGANHQGQKDISERAIEYAKSGVGIISSMAKTVWSEYVSGSTPSSSPSSKNKAGTRKMSSPQQLGLAQGEDVPTMVAHRIERYLNYLFENDALSTSIALNAILRASQSGLESAKQTLQDHSKHKKPQRSNFVSQTSSRGGRHSAASIFSALVSKTQTSFFRIQEDEDAPWLRSAAQVAMALQFHGILETTGHETTSAKIQHASLPKFCNRSARSWDDEETDDKTTKNGKMSHHSGLSECDSPRSETNFEVGVINVDSELADEEDLGGYDMLPSPGPSEEHRVLNAGSAVRGKGSLKSQGSRSRFVYGTNSEQTGEIYDRKDSVLGSIRVEKDIDKLRDIIRSINHTLGKLHQSSILVKSAQNARNMIQLDLLRDIDSWGDSGGEVISQRALVEGVAALETYSSVVDESNAAMAEDLLWQSSLATSAVAAVTEVRNAVRASHTASRAKSAAFSAAEKAKKAYESCDHSSSKEKIQHTQTEASTTQSHAIHATVVEYEANAAKKRSALSLAQDMKTWNIHRKRELLQTCVQVAKSQQEACGKAADAWESLREGLINSSGCSYAKEEVNMWTHPSSSISQVCPTPTTACTQDILASGLSSTLDDFDGEITQNHLTSKKLENSSSLHDWENDEQDFPDCVAEAPNSASSSATEAFTECAAEASNSISSVVREFTNLSQQSSSDNVYCLSPPDISNLVEDYFSIHEGNREESNSDSDDDGDGGAPSICESVHSGNESEGLPNGDSMSMSMQSLIDGLMAWGGEDEQKNNDGAIKQSNIDQLNSLLE